MANKTKTKQKNQGQQIYERSYEHCILHFSEFLMQFHKNIHFWSRYSIFTAKFTVIMVGSKHQKKPGVDGVNRTQFSSTNTLEGITLSLLIQRVSSLHPTPRCKTGTMKIQILNLVILRREGKHFPLILFQTMFYLLSNSLERSWIWDIKKYKEYISNTCMPYRLWISTYIELKMSVWPFVLKILWSYRTTIPHSENWKYIFKLGANTDEEKHRFECCFCNSCDLL